MAKVFSSLARNIQIRPLLENLEITISIAHMDKISRDVLESQLDKSHTLEKATILRYMDTMSFNVKVIAGEMLRHEYI